jgi:hypothetical protein
MRALILAALLLVFAVETADARKRRHYRHYPYAVVMPPDARGAMERRPEDPRMRDMRPDDPRMQGMRPGDPRMQGVMPRSARRGAPSVTDLVPPGWQQQPPDPNWSGKRFISPDGNAWFAAYTAPADTRPAAEHMKEVAFADGETITYLRGERSWLAVSGFKDSRIFYRRALLACAGRKWHHIAFEYPAEQKLRMDPFIELAGQILVASQAECEDVASTTGQRQ